MFVIRESGGDVSDGERMGRESSSLTRQTALVSFDAHRLCLLLGCRAGRHGSLVLGYKGGRVRVTRLTMEGYFCE